MATEPIFGNESGDELETQRIEAPASFQWTEATKATFSRLLTSTQESILMHNWRPVAPFRDRWDDELIEEVVPVGSYPSSRLRVASR